MIKKKKKKRKTSTNILVFTPGGKKKKDKSHGTYILVGETVKKQETRFGLVGRWQVLRMLRKCSVRKWEQLSGGALGLTYSSANQSTQR